ncbi:MAG TPA: hypothetical protein VFF06_03345 [Polyangia bacterium]|nr:hypothetical protein [Polyangia bacterium]
MGAFTVFRDVSLAGGARTLTSTFYVLPDAPRVARDDDGGPAFRFWWYRRALDPKAASPVRAGGLVVITVELAPSSDERAQLTHDLAAKFNFAESAINLLPLPFVSGTVELDFAAESGAVGGEFARQIAGNGPAKLAGGEQAAFAIDLTADGAALLADALDKKLDVLQVRYDLVYTYHLDGVRLHVWCDARKAQLAAQAQAGLGPIDVAALRSGLTASQLAGIDISSDTPVPPEQQTALTTLGQQLLDAALAQTVLTPDGKGARPYDQSIAGTLNHTFTSSFGATQHAVADALLPLGLDDATRGSRMVIVDLASEPQPIDVTIACPIDFTAGLIGAVHFFIAYDGTGPDGKPLHRADDFLFKVGTTRATFHSLASADSRSYRWHAEVFYRDGSTVTLPEVTTDERILVLALDGLGVLDVEAALGDVPLDGVSSVIVDLEYPPKQLTHQLFLDGAHAADSWQAVIGDAQQPGALRWRATFLTNDGRRVAGDWQPAASMRLTVDAPPGLISTANVQVIAAGDFQGVAQLLVELRAAAGADATELRFTQPGQAQTWAPRLAPGATLAYQSRTTVLGDDGISRAFDWTNQDSPLLVVSDLSRFSVQVIARLLDLGGAWSAAVVSFEHADPQANLDERDTVVLRDRAIDGRWSFHVGSAGQHKYRYQLTLVPKGGGERRVLPWQEAEDEVIVLRPPDG